jgi:hypothetical protein
MSNAADLNRDGLQDVSRFEALQVEWNELAVATKQRQLGAWTEAMANLIAEDEAIRAAGKWTYGRTDTLGIIGRARLELNHSAMLAWLLTPTSKHHLGTRFLARFLERCRPGRAHQGLGRVQVDCEIARGDVRVDVLIRTEGLTLVIENKVDADEGVEQCDRIVRQFGSEPGAIFVFLAPTKRAPKTDTHCRFVPLSYREIRDDLEWLAPTLNKSERGTATVYDYLETLRWEFP